LTYCRHHHVINPGNHSNDASKIALGARERATALPFVALAQIVCFELLKAPFLCLMTVGSNGHS
jgi:hypothetical protein